MLKNLGKLKYLTKEKELKINLNELKSGINFFESFIIYHDISDIKIYDRKCDHAGGKIISKDGNAVARCPKLCNIIREYQVAELCSRLLFCQYCSLFHPFKNA